MKFGLLGSGSWGTALAKVIAENGYTLHWYIRDNEVRNHILLEHTHPKYLQGIRLPVSQLELTTELYPLIQHCEYIILAVPSAFLDATLSPLPENCLANKYVISAIKGLEYQNGQLISGYLRKRFHVQANNFAAIAGPG
ncbi:MAG: NAD(P)-binding domain-containing protein, partial [Bacteroidia bacterium]|nr:NAD(P)-binding domain-containing protein [Bacteroidia bacterium]